MLKQRIQILKDGGVVSEKTEQFMYFVIDLMDGLENIDGQHIDARRAETFTTHLAMAVERMVQGNVVDPMDRNVYEEVCQCPEFEAAQKFYDSFAAKSPVGIPESEKEFLLLHICNLLQG